jgi:hypothetical protein
MNAQRKYLWQRAKFPVNAAIDSAEDIEHQKIITAPLISNILEDFNFSDKIPVLKVKN